MPKVGTFIRLRVTFDTNTLDLACRPERFPKDPRQDLLGRVNGALRNGAIEGFYSVTMLTLEGIMKKDRAAVFANSSITSTEHPTKAPTIHDQRAVERAFAEWADGDSLAAHLAYGLDIFCTGDIGRSNAGKSVLDAENRTWLSSTYGLRFMTFDELAATLS